MKGLFAFAVLLTLAASQCSFEGNTYTTEDGRSLTFGVAVGEWVPGLTTITDGSHSFSTWTQATASRWHVKDFASTATWFCNEEGTYAIEFTKGCSEIHFTVLHDLCGDRMSLLKNDFTLSTTNADTTCTAVGTRLSTHFSKSTDYPRLSGDKVNFVFGLNNYALVSVADRAVIVQRWKVESGEEDTVKIVDLASYPAGYACGRVNVGVYTTDFNDDCTSRLCFSEDACSQRAELFHNIGLNNFEGDVCNEDIPANDLQQHCSIGKQWLRHPDECVAQDVEGGCMFCKGIAMGVTTMWCLDRQGTECNQIFDSTVRQAYCNVEFECPGSSVGASLVIFICSLLAFIIY